MDIEPPERGIAEIGAALSRRVEELSGDIADAIRAEIDFYRDARVVSEERLRSSCAANVRYICSGLLGDDRGFDTTTAADTGAERAGAGAPLPAVMEAFRIGFRVFWGAMIEEAARHPNIDNAALLRVTGRVWIGQGIFTQAMIEGYREVQTQKILDDEAERSALVEALLQGRVLEERSLWDLAELLRIPAAGPYVVVAARAPEVGRQPLPNVAAKLAGLGIVSAWRLLPDLHVGIVHLRAPDRMAALTGLLVRTAHTRVGVSPPYDDLADTAQALHYARIACAGHAVDGAQVTVFDDSVLGIAAVSSPEVMTRLIRPLREAFADLTADERQILFDTFTAWVEHDGSVAEAAARLYCHPNTVRHRLRRIEERTGRTLAHPREVAELCLLLEAHRRLG